VTSGGGIETAWAEIVSAFEARRDWIQIREKTAAASELFELCRRARQLSGTTKIILNDRFDLALAARLDGVHLPGNGLPLERVRAAAGRNFLVGISCHSVAEVAAAQSADYCLLGPIFDTPEKRRFGAPLGLGNLKSAVALGGPPVLAIGGVNAGNRKACREAGAAGVAGIRLFASVV